MDNITESHRETHAMRFRSNLQGISIYVSHRRLSRAGILLSTIHTNSKHNGRAPLGYGSTVSSGHAAYIATAGKLLGICHAYRMSTAQSNLPFRRQRYNSHTGQWSNPRPKQPAHFWVSCLRAHTRFTAPQNGRHRVPGCARWLLNRYIWLPDLQPVHATRYNHSPCSI